MWLSDLGKLSKNFDLSCFRCASKAKYRPPIVTTSWRLLEIKMDSLVNREKVPSKLGKKLLEEGILFSLLKNKRNSLPSNTHVGGLQFERHLSNDKPVCMIW